MIVFLRGHNSPKTGSLQRLISKPPENAAHHLVVNESAVLLYQTCKAHAGLLGVLLARSTLPLLLSQPSPAQGPALPTPLLPPRRAPAGLLPGDGSCSLAARGWRAHASFFFFAASTPVLHQHHQAGVGSTAPERQRSQPSPSRFVYAHPAAGSQALPCNCSLCWTGTVASPRKRAERLKDCGAAGNLGESRRDVPQTGLRDTGTCCRQHSTLRLRCRLSLNEATLNLRRTNCTVISLLDRAFPGSPARSPHSGAPRAQQEGAAPSPGHKEARAATTSPCLILPAALRHVLPGTGAWVPYPDTPKCCGCSKKKNTVCHAPISEGTGIRLILLIALILLNARLWLLDPVRFIHYFK